MMRGTADSCPRRQHFRACAVFDALGPGVPASSAHRREFRQFKWHPPARTSACGSQSGSFNQATDPSNKPENTPKMKTIQLAIAALALAAFPAISFAASKACDKCCKDKGKDCKTCCADAGKKCGTDCCKKEK